MSKYSELQLRDKDILPTNETLKKVLVDSFDLYKIFQNKLADLGIEQDWQWYTPHKSWYAKGQYFWTSIRGVQKEKNIYWLHVYKGYFSVVVWFKEKNRDLVLKTNVSKNTKQIIRNAKTEMGLPTFPVIFNVTNAQILTDIYTIIDYKKKIECK